MNKLSASSLVEKLIAEDKNILILDTCCVLDVIRCIQRENLPVLKATIEIINLFDKNQNKFVIVLPSLINTEWSDNNVLVCSETKCFIEKCDTAHKNLIQSFGMVFPIQVNAICCSHYNFEKILSDFSEKLLDLSFSLESIEECKINAINRVVQHIPPAAQGKDSTKDCIIFEETLYLGNLLRNSGFTKKIVFASSNTKEYFHNRKPINTIEVELGKVGIEIATSLNHGLYFSQV
jgi:hypothetical protein